MRSLLLRDVASDRRNADIWNFGRIVLDHPAAACASKTRGKKSEHYSIIQILTDKRTKLILVRLRRLEPVRSARFVLCTRETERQATEQWAPYANEPIEPHGVCQLKSITRNGACSPPASRWPASRTATHSIGSPGKKMFDRVSFSSNFSSFRFSSLMHSGTRSMLWWRWRRVNEGISRNRLLSWLFCSVFCRVFCAVCWLCTDS